MQAPKENQFAMSSATPHLEILISTCNARLAQVLSCLLPANPAIGYIVIHQIFAENTEQSWQDAAARLKARADVCLLQTASRGLAKSRNMALRAATAPLVLLADDDITFTPELLAIVTGAFAALPAADVITFRFTNEQGQHRKRYPTAIVQRSYRNFFKVSSVEVALRREALQSSGVRFDERFGLGAEYPVSEENIFLADLHKAGKKIYFYPADLLVHPDETSGANWNNTYLRARGALFRRVFGWVGLPLLLLFIAKHRRHVRAQAGFVKGSVTAIKSFISFGGKA